ncbi:PHP domain-containing protein [Halomarina oriensis]|uniref:PHP domain-containing protein n=1 Tax=Halomarina oriensis TaxID=671145 RepID=A0A6B0GIE8_9EURY|nr:PHP domain-containing protein [Halomarina oriensis]MWG34400.1 PHP domain-containing protein [Halomarina oriensis]
MVVADLHTHTTNSDGQFTLETLVAAAREYDVRVVAVTDHDRTHPDLNTPVTHVDGVTVVHGIELRVDAGDQEVDLLGYAVTDTASLGAETDRIQADRIERARKTVALVEAETGVDLDVAFEPGVGRPHVARAVAESDAPYDYEGAFDHLIGDDGPCYVARAVPSFERGVDLLSEACGLVGLAHPLRYGDPEAALALCDRLDAVEYHYDYGREVDLRPVERAIEEYGLTVTGGSDAHDEVLGRAGLDRDEYRAFRNAVSL